MPIVPILVAVIAVEPAATVISVTGDISFTRNINGRNVAAGYGSDESQETDNRMLGEDDSYQADKEDSPNKANDDADETR